MMATGIRNASGFNPLRITSIVGNILKLVHPLAQSCSQGIQYEIKDPSFYHQIDANWLY